MSILPLFDRKDFFYDRYLTNFQNFQNLALFEKWNEEEYDLNYEEFQNQILEVDPHHLPHFLPFFLKYIENNGFIYDEDLNKEDNFDCLVNHMKWNKKIVVRKWKSLKEQIEEYKIYEFDENKRDLSIFEFDDVFKYFDFYADNYNFKYSRKKNALENFKELCKFMDWNNFYYKNMRIFNSKTTKDKISWLKLIAKNEKIQITIDENSPNNLYDYFKNIAKQLNWNDLFNLKKTELDDFIAINLGKDLNNLLKLKEIITFYDLHTEFNNKIIPNSKTQCRRLIRNYLYVNIYDYVGKSTRRFNNLKDLQKYTFRTKFFYPLSKAKDDYKLKIMLRPLKN